MPPPDAARQQMKSNQLPDAPFPGKILAVEGLDGSGKSTQLRLLRTWLESRGHRARITEWNSSEFVRPLTRQGKKARSLSATTFSLLHCADLADRMEREILPLLHAGYLVLCDRYTYTALARDRARGVDPGWVREIYAFAPRPTLVIYFRTPVDVALKRILGGRPKLKYHEAGMDIGLASTYKKSFMRYQTRVLQAYETMVDEHGFAVVDATAPVQEQQMIVRRLAQQALALKAHANGAVS